MRWLARSSNVRKSSFALCAGLSFLACTPTSDTADLEEEASINISNFVCHFQRNQTSVIQLALVRSEGKVKCVFDFPTEESLPGTCDLDGKQLFGCISMEGSWEIRSAQSKTDLEGEVSLIRYGLSDVMGGRRVVGQCKKSP